MNNTIIKNILLSGVKGDDGDAATTDTTVPIDGMIVFDGQTIPAGYEEVQ